MTRKWFRELGFVDNPLSIKPRFKGRLFGYDALLEEIFYRIESGNMIFLEGKVGKTSVLLKIIEKYKGKGKVAYIDCRKEKQELDIGKVVRRGRKIIKSKGDIPKEMIMLLDNVSELSRKNTHRMKYFFDQGNILSIIFTGERLANARIPLSIKHRIGKRNYKLKDLTEDEAVDLVLDRLDFKDYLGEEQIYKIAARSSNLNELFANCEAALQLMIDENENSVDDRLIKKIFRIKEDVMV